MELSFSQKNICASHSPKRVPPPAEIKSPPPPHELLGMSYPCGGSPRASFAPARDFFKPDRKQLPNFGKNMPSHS